MANGNGNATMQQVVEGAQPQAGGMIPFRRASTFRTNRLPSTTGTVTAAEQIISQQIEGAGYLSAVDLAVDIETESNVAVVAYHEDAPYNALSSVVLGDVNGELVNLEGYNLYLANLAGRWKRQIETGVTDASIFEQITGAGAGRGGSVHFHLKVPTSINWRNLIGLVGNQDRGQKYFVRSNFAATGTIYTVAPTNPGALTVDRTYENYAVPGRTNSDGVAQEIEPPTFGVLHYLTQSVNPTPPVSSATRNHYLSRIGNTIRYLILVFRDGNGATARAGAEANPPSLIKFMIGDTPIFSEDWGYRKTLMFSKWGFQWPNGVLVYDWITDIIGAAGDELGDDWLFTNGLTNSQFEISYPAGWAADSSLTVVTDDLVIPEGMNIYALVG